MSADWTIPSIPAEVKSLSPFFQRAQELRVKDPVMSYWCTYYAAQEGISLKAQTKDARSFLFQILNILEQMKANLTDNEAVTDDDAGAAYIENFALRVFNMADNEDRNEQATRSTAKKFLASANFFELLRIFDKPAGTDIEEKVRYAKWKAADLAKAFREGRKPNPGDANAPSMVSPPHSAATLEPPPHNTPSMSAWSPDNSIVPSPAVHGLHSLEPSPISGSQVPLPPTVSDASPRSSKQPLTPERSTFSLPPDSGPTLPSTPSPRSFGGHLILNREHDGFATPGTWSTMATPGTEDVYQQDMGGISESPSARVAAARRSKDMATDEEASVDPAPEMAPDDSWSTVGNESMSRQNSWSVAETETTPLASEGVSGIGLDLQPNEEVPSVVTPIKKVHFSPSVVGGISSTSSSVAGSSPPGSPGGGYTPTLSTVPETIPYSASEASPRPSAPPVIQKITSPPTSPNGLSSSSSPQVPSTLLPSVPLAKPHVGGPPLPQFPVPPSHHAAGSSFPAPPTVHPTARSSAPTFGHHPPPPPPPPAELTSTQIARIQKHCRFAISALDYEDAETARKELCSALAMLGN